MIKLRQYQKDAVIKTIEFLEDSKGNPIIAMPTGTGKSLVIAALIRYYNKTCGKRILVLTHVKELIEQNIKATKKFCGKLDIGINSAGLKQRDFHNQIIFAGIASVKRSAQMIGHIDIVIIDECHLVPAKKSTMYRKLLDNLTIINPSLVTIGLSATPYRLTTGRLTNKGGIFNGVSYDSTTMAAFNKYISDGYLCNLIAQETDEQIDVSHVRIAGDDYVQKELQEATDKMRITKAAVAEIIERASNRKHWLIFTTGIQHSANVVAELRRRAITAVDINCNTDPLSRKRLLLEFKAGKIRAMVNANILTTGFDFPAIDLIGVLRPMCSPGLWVQSLGRGTRPYKHKRNCLVLDFAGNTRRLGPINDVIIPDRQKTGKGRGQAPVKRCIGCGVLVHLSVSICPQCSKPFPHTTKLAAHAGNNALIATAATPTYIDVDKISYTKYYSNRSPTRPLLRVTYWCGQRKYMEYVSLQAPWGSFQRRFAGWWWRRRTMSAHPKTVDEALLRLDELSSPKQIRVVRNKNNFNEIKNIRF